jgi:hypothetical protein
VPIASEVLEQPVDPGALLRVQHDLDIANDWHPES